MEGRFGERVVVSMMVLWVLIVVVGY